MGIVLVLLSVITIINNSASARGERGEGNSCIYGGWVSTVGGEGCRHPYSGSDRYAPCGLHGVHRCNPLIFGESDRESFPGSNPGKGICVESENENSSFHHLGLYQGGLRFWWRCRFGPFSESSQKRLGCEPLFGEVSAQGYRDH